MKRHSRLALSSVLFCLFLSASPTAIANAYNKTGISSGEHFVPAPLSTFAPTAHAASAASESLIFQIAGAGETENVITVPYGSSATLSWSYSGAGSCYARSHAGGAALKSEEVGYWEGTKPTNGSEAVSGLTAPYYVYTLQCGAGFGNGGYFTKEVWVYVGSPGAPVPNNPDFYTQWGLFNRGSILGPSLISGSFPNLTSAPEASINAPEGWSVSTEGSGKIVAVIDTGVDWEHPDLAANIWTNPHPTDGDLHGYNFYAKNGNPVDESGHGTNVAGIIGAVANSGLGTAGVAWKAQIMDVKVMGGTESSFTATSEYEGIHYAVEHGASIINASFGGKGTDPESESAYRYAEKHGVLIVAAAGNESNDMSAGSNQFYPCAYDHTIPNIICVGSNGPTGVISTFSNYGNQITSLFAPGGLIYSTVPPFVNPSGYAFYEGTSMATPFVSGAVALYWTHYPTATAAQVKAAILGSVTKTPEMEEKSISGGHLNLGTLMRTPPPPLPIAVVHPRVTGKVLVGRLLRCQRGVWSGDPTRYSYLWRIGSRSTHSPTYRVRRSDAGRRVSCAVTAMNNIGSVSATSSNDPRARR